ncbi:GspH/FimT family pseudopilin [Microbulbifer elongatus]|uniref:Type II secretion system protein H n=1 Tax=Microbulbifer elongatus TaxID=86173 RepID=A0ABT1P3S0_9GAMM|nr:GspH/FimT family pseudopilin [Microbulbifer elongatus]
MQRQPGFTLIELIVGIAILAIAISLAAPSMSELVRRYRSESKAQELFDLLIFMRVKAYSEQQRYTLCPIGADSNCGNDWALGAMLFADSDADGEKDADEMVERTFSGAEAGGTLNWRAFNNLGYITFRPNGTTPAQSGHFAYCPPNRDEKIGWIIVLNVIGRPYFGKDRDGDGVRETGSGDNLSCSTASN